jgi:hypothetical protein
MSLLAVFRPKPAPVRQPGRHSAEWAAMVQGVAALQAELSAAKGRAVTAETERDSLRVELVQAEEQHADDTEEWEAALDFTSREYAQLQDECERLTRENEALHKLLDDGDGQPGTAPTVAPADDPQSCFSQPSPPPAPDSRRAEPFPDAPATYDIADVNAETQAVDVRTLRQGAEATQQLAVPAVAWTIAAVPPLPPEVAPTLAMPLAEALAAPPVEASPVTGQRAHDSVHAAVTT